MDTVFIRNQKELDAVDPNDKIKVIIDAPSIELFSISKTYYWLDIKGQSVIQHVSDSATIQHVYGSAAIRYVSGSAAIQYIYGSATIQSVYGSATIGSVCGSANIGVAGGNSVIIADHKKIKIKTKHKAQVVYRSQERCSIGAKDFAEIMGITVTRGSVCLFKSVNPQNHMDFYTGEIKYKGVVKCPDFDPDPSIQCGKGLHLSPTPEFALSYNQGKVLKCRVALKDIAVFSEDLTKVRCRRVKVIGEHKQGE